MTIKKDLKTDATITWCPGCANFAIMNSLQKVLLELEKEQEMDLNKVVLASGIGCHAKIVDYINTNSFHSIHGRVPPTLAGIGPASAPAAVTNVVEGLRAKGRFTDTLLGIVAIDDAWGLIVFSVLLAVAMAISGHGGWSEALSSGGLELGGALLIGIVLGVPAAWLTDHIRAGEPMQAEALGFIFVCGGLAQLINASFILAAMIMGAVIANTAKHTNQAFDTIREFEWPIMILFFVLAGSSLHISKLPDIGSVGLIYILLRIIGLVAGAYLGGSIGKAGRHTKHYMGLAITPQAGVALGMALVAANHFPDLKNTFIPLVIGTTVVFEIVGPVFTLLAVNLSGESGRDRQADSSPDT